MAVDNVGAYAQVIKVSGATVGATATTYASGDLVGNKLTLSDVVRDDDQPNNTAACVAIAVQDLDKQDVALDVIFFDSDPDGTTFTDDSALDVADADLPKILGHIPVLASDYVDFNDSSIATVDSRTVLLEPASGRDIYAAIVSGGAPTYTADGLSLVFHILQN